MEEMLKVMNQVVTFAMSLFTTITGNADPFLHPRWIFGWSCIHVFRLLKGAAR